MTEEQMAQVKAMQAIAEEHHKRAEMQRQNAQVIAANALDSTKGCEYKGEVHGWQIIEVDGKAYRLTLDRYNSGSGIFDNFMSHVYGASKDATDKVRQELCVEVGRKICEAMTGKVDEIGLYGSSNAAVIVMYAGGKKFGVTVTHDDASDNKSFYRDVTPNDDPQPLHS